MRNEKEIKEQLEVLENELDSCKLNFIKNKVRLETYYHENYEKQNWYDSNTDKQVEYEPEGFEQLYQDDLNYLNEQISFIEGILSLEIVQQSKFNTQMLTLINDCIEEMGYENYDGYYEGLLFELIHRTNYDKEYKAITILHKFSGYNQNIVLIGGNGSGKSNLAKTIKGNDQKNISVIPAQKNLYFTLDDKSMLTATRRDLEKLLLENNIDKSKNRDDGDYFRFQNQQFTKLIIAAREEYEEYSLSCIEQGEKPEKYKMAFGSLLKVFESLFPDIELHLHANDDCLMCKKMGQTYHINALSDGEKAVIYYALNVFMSGENSFIVVDEPETYLNPSLATNLWDLLIQMRQDCQFIFITHSIDFVLSRGEAQIAWIENYAYPYDWNFKFLEKNFPLPKTLITEILGSRKPIMFCEGDDKGSIDYRIYRALFEEQFTVIPVGGHNEVIQYCKVIKNTEWLGINCQGIIDGDNISEEQKGKLYVDNIHVLPFNEIEMLLFSEDVLDYIMDIIYPEKSRDKVQKFIEAFWDSVVDEKNVIALSFVKNNVDEYLGKEKIAEYKSISDIQNSLNSLSSYNVKEIYDRTIEKLTKIIDDRDYDSLLAVCNLKKEISKGLANKYLDNNYEEKAIEKISYDKNLQALIKKKYFNF